MNSLALLIMHGVVGSCGLLIMKLHLAGAKTSIINGDFFERTVLIACSGFTLYILSFALWMIILVRSQLSYAYPISVGITLIATSLLSIFFLHESIGVVRGVGMMFILIGVVVIHKSI
jgi:multidrug transporter EmrE-like cation transporter